MPKILDQPLLVVAPQYADQLTVTSYRVDAQTRTAIVSAVASRDDGQGGRVYLEFPDRALDKTATLRAMSRAGAEIACGVLAAAGQPQRVIDAVRAALDADPSIAPTAYYVATRDAIYSEL